MSCFEGHFRAMVPELESRLRSYLTGFFAGIVRGYLPLTRVRSTEGEEVTIKVDSNGKATGVPGRDPKLGLTVRTSQARLAAALRTRRREAVPPGVLEVVPTQRKAELRSSIFVPSSVFSQQTVQRKTLRTQVRISLIRWAIFTTARTAVAAFSIRS